ncbi:MAG: hypothetical protein HY466_04900, partial [Deltaproteobacteria bacterium]|nr:hypothetical protein [Deltaproteobacteria bacterium]
MKRPSLSNIIFLNAFALFLTLPAYGRTKAEGWLGKETLLNATTSAKRFSGKQGDMGTAIFVPPRSRRTVTFTSYCLNPHGAGPHTDEKFIWSRQDTNIPYLKEVLVYAGSHSEIRQTEIQSLIWNLARGVWFENYPAKQKAILFAIDPAAPAKLPSKAREEAKHKAKQALFKAVPALK